MNTKKINSARRKRPVKSLATHKVIYEEVKHKSRAGVEYTHNIPRVVKI